MLRSQFEESVEKEIEKIKATLLVKGKEYAEDKLDRLCTFKQAAALEGGTQEQALGGMLAKHITSIYNMLDTPLAYTKARWEEKIGDYLVYGLLLKAMIDEEFYNRDEEDTQDYEEN